MLLKIILAATEVHLYRNHILIKFESKQSIMAPFLVNFTKDTQYLQSFRIESFSDNDLMLLNQSSIAVKSSENFNRVSLRVLGCNALVLNNNANNVVYTISALIIHKEEDLSDPKPKYWIIPVIIVALILIIAGVWTLSWYCKKRLAAAIKDPPAVEQEIYEEISLGEVGAVYTRDLRSGFQSPRDIVRRLTTRSAADADQQRISILPSQELVLASSGPLVLSGDLY